MASLGDMFKLTSEAWVTSAMPELNPGAPGLSGGLPSPAKMDAAALMSDPAMEPPGLSPAQPAPDVVFSPYEMEKDAFAAEAAAQPGTTLRDMLHNA